MQWLKTTVCLVHYFGERAKICVILLASAGLIHESAVSCWVGALLLGVGWMLTGVMGRGQALSHVFLIIQQEILGFPPHRLQKGCCVCKCVPLCPQL